MGLQLDEPLQIILNLFFCKELDIVFAFNHVVFAIL